MQNESGIKTPTCILGSDVQDFANEGIQRALVARQKAMELTVEELDSVGGGLPIKNDPILVGFAPLGGKLVPPPLR
jgi:hypothetical protein